jgi:replication-associated recombination protein RarA
MSTSCFYEPTERGFERTLRERMQWLKEQKKAKGEKE